MFNSVWGTNKVMPKVNPSLQTIIVINIKMTYAKSVSRKMIKESARNIASSVNMIIKNEVRDRAYVM
jgi:hypothetical protein